MAFPTTGILDSFVRSNGALGANWTSPVSVDSQTLTIASDAVKATSSGAGMAAWNTAFSTTIEAYAKISVLPGTGNYVGVAVIDDKASPNNGYVLEVTQPSSWVLYSYIAGSIASIATGTQTLSAGDWIGISATHGAQAVYYSHDGVTFTAVASATNTGLTVGSWFVSMEIARATGRISQFGGGTTVSAATVNGASAVALSDTFASAGVRQTFGVTASALTDAFTSVGARATFGATALTETLTTTTTAAAGTISGATALALTDTLAAAGTRTTFGATTNSLVDTFTATGLLATFGVSALSETATFTVTASGAAVVGPPQAVDEPTVVGAKMNTLGYPATVADHMTAAFTAGRK